MAPQAVTVTDLDDLEKNWDTFGRTIPMRSILWKQEAWSTDEFFETGRVQIDDALRRLGELGVRPSGGRALDFGCGIGRLTQALAVEFDEAVGVDIAASMIELAREHNRVPQRCTYEQNVSADLRLFPSTSFDLVYSVITLQHIRPEVSQRYIREFTRVLRPHGIAMFQLPSELRAPIPFPPEGLSAELELLSLDGAPPGPVEKPPDDHLRLGVRVRNTSAVAWEPGHRVTCGGQWYAEEGTRQIDDQGPSEHLTQRLEPGDHVTLDVQAAVPARPGDYVLRLGLQHARVTFPADAARPLAVVVTVAGAGREDEPDDGEASTVQMEMHPVPRDDVVRIVQQGGCEVVAIDDDFLSGPDWVSYVYVVRKRPMSMARLVNRVAMHTPGPVRRSRAIGWMASRALRGGA